MKSIALMALAQETSRQLTIDCGCLLMITIMQIYNEKEQGGQRGMQNVQFEERKKKNTRKCNIGA